MAIEPNIEKRIAQEQAKIEVPSYQDIAFDGAWKSRTRYMWGLSIVGAVAGAVIGAAALAAPALLGGLAFSGALLAKSVVAFSALGLSAGWSVGAFAGFPAGAAASTMKEFERRTLARDIEQKIRDNPNAAITMDEHEVSKNKDKGGIDGYYNWKVAIAMGAIGALGGAIFAAALTMGGPALSFAMPAMDFLLSTVSATGEIVAPSISTVVAYTVGVGALAGSVFGTNIPRIGREMGEFMGGILSGKSIGAPWPKHANLPEPKPILAPKIVEETQDIAPEKAENFAAKFAPKEEQSHLERVNQAALTALTVMR